MIGMLVECLELTICFNVWQLLLQGVGWYTYNVHVYRNGM